MNHLAATGAVWAVARRRRDGRMILVVGATGVLGGLVSHRLAGLGRTVRGLVRETSDQGRRAELTAAGIETVAGDLRDAASLARACAGVTTVITTASAIMSSQPGNSVAATDRDGQLALVDAARAAGVTRVILVSFPEQPVDSPLQQAKRAVERRLIEGGSGYTILRPTMFMESWLSPALGFDPANRAVRRFGDGTVPHHWIAVSDVADYVVGAVDNALANGTVLDLGGPDALSVSGVVEIFEEVTGERFTVDEVPVDALHKEYEAATDPAARSFAALTLACALGTPMDPQPATTAIPIGHRTSVREYADRLAGRG